MNKLTPNPDYGRWEWMAEDEHLGRQSLLNLLLAGDDADLIAEPAALQLVQHSAFHQEVAAAARLRRVIPARRHLRNK